MSDGDHLIITRYTPATDKNQGSYAVRGNTKEYKTVLAGLKLRFNPNLQGGAGWIVPASRIDVVTEGLRKGKVPFEMEGEKKTETKETYEKKRVIHIKDYDENDETYVVTGLILKDVKRYGDFVQEWEEEEAWIVSSEVIERLIEQLKDKTIIKDDTGKLDTEPVPEPKKVEKAQPKKTEKAQPKTRILDHVFLEIQNSENEREVVVQIVTIHSEKDKGTVGGDPAVVTDYDSSGRVLTLKVKKEDFLAIPHNGQWVVFRDGELQPFVPA